LENHEETGGDGMPVTPEFDASIPIAMILIGITFLIIFLILRKRKIGKNDVIEAFDDTKDILMNVTHIKKPVDPLNVEALPHPEDIEEDDYKAVDHVTLKWSEKLKEREIIEVEADEIIEEESPEEPEEIIEVEPLLEPEPEVDEKIYACENCPEDRLHTKENIFQCPDCGKFFCDRHYSGHVYKKHRSKDYIVYSNDNFVSSYVRGR